VSRDDKNDLSMKVSLLVTIQSRRSDQKFIGFVLVAENDRSNAVGTWSSSDAQVKTVSCGGVMHQSTKEKVRVDVNWYPTLDLDGHIYMKYFDRSRRYSTHCVIHL
jgi:hypothetical protein